MTSKTFCMEDNIPGLTFAITLIPAQNNNAIDKIIITVDYHFQLKSLNFIQNREIKGSLMSHRNKVNFFVALFTNLCRIWRFDIVIITQAV